MTPIEITTLVLSLVALIVTVIGFFASLNFYRSGVEMNNQSRSALAKIEEKAASIHTQVDGMFNKTLDVALGRSNSAEAEKKQAILQESSSSHATTLTGEKSELSGSKGLSSGLENEEEPALSSNRYFSFKEMRMTDVIVEPSRSIFNLGAGNGLNLFDGVNEIIFFGYFHTLGTAEIVLRSRNLFTNINRAYDRLSENPGSPQINAAKRLLDQISLELLVPEGTSLKKLESKLNEFQPSARTISIILHTPSEIQKKVNDEYQRMAV